MKNYIVLEASILLIFTVTTSCGDPHVKEETDGDGGDETLDCSERTGIVSEVIEPKGMVGTNARNDYFDDGSIVVTGSFSSEETKYTNILVDFAKSITLGKGQPNETTLTTDREYALFVAKYAADGMLVWAKKIDTTEGGDGVQPIAGVAVLSDNSIVITAGFGLYGATITFEPGTPNETTLQPAGKESAYIAHYLPDGTFDWAKALGAGGYTSARNYTSARDVAALSDDSFVLTGYFSERVVFGQGEPSETALEAVGSQDVFIARYHADGRLVWAKQAGGDLRDMGYLIVGMDDGAVVVGGVMMGPMIFGAGSRSEIALEKPASGGGDIFIAKYDENGSVLWAKNAIATYSEGENTLAIFDLSADPQGSIFLTGGFWLDAVFGPDDANETTLSTSCQEMYIAKYDSRGVLLWAKQAGIKDCDAGRSYGNTKAALPDGAVLVGGRIGAISKQSGTQALFGAGEPNETELRVVGENDAFVALYNADGSLAWVEQFGTPGNDDIGDISVLPDGSVRARVSLGDDLELCTSGGNLHNPTAVGPGNYLFQLDIVE